MAVTTDNQAAGALVPAQVGSRRPAARPAAAQADRVWSAGLALGLLGISSCGLVLTRLVASWRVGPHVAAHRVSVLGQRLGYPAANVWAIAIVALALVGLLVTAMVVLGTARELAASRRLARDLARRTRPGVGCAHVIDDPAPVAFCAGLLRPRVFVSSAAVALLDDDALEAVLAHERQHARRRDPLRLATGRVLARALFFVPGLGVLARCQPELAELRADEAAIGEDDSRRGALARAMLVFTSADDHRAGIDPARVDQLLGEPPSWRFPSLLCLGGTAVLALLIALAVLLGHLASGSATLALPLLSRQPCMVVLALIPAAGWILAGRLRSTLRGRP